MSNKQKPSEAAQLTPEELKQAEEDSKNGTTDIRLLLIQYGKRFNGYPYIAASRIERAPVKGERASVLYNQLLANHVMKSLKDQTKAMEDFMEVYGNGRLVFFQAFTECPTLGADGLYSSISINGTHIKSDLVGYYKIADMEAVPTTDETSEEGYDYLYRDKNDQLMDLGVNPGIPLKEYYALHTKLLKRKHKPDFTPIIIVKQGPDKFGLITGDPYPPVPPEVIAEVLKKQAVERPQQPSDQK